MEEADDEKESYASYGVGEEYGRDNVGEEEDEEAESVLTEYDPDDYNSGAVNTEDSTIPLDLFEFEHSYGYDCHKYFNLCACDETVICWASGSIITFFDVVTQQVWFRRTSTGGSVGALCSYRKDPSYRIAIAEGREGEREPIIILYTWPQMEIDAVLRDGTTNAYSCLDFNPEGELLASVGRDPDYNLTIWNWKKHRIMLRTSAFTFDVNAVLFSTYCPGQLTTAGAAHIKFWKMAETFTGLKLKGELGRFGKTEICDILGFYQMPDEKVISGCEWGNVLVWEAGLVKVEVTQRGRKACHAAPVIQFMLSDKYDEVTTIARDGCVRAWYWDTVDQADPPEEDPFVELNPVAETCVPGCQIMYLVHQKDMYWYAQDGNGGIWTVDLEIDKLECNHNKVLTTHAGPIVGMAALRTHPILITAGTDGALMAYDTQSHTLLARYIFQTPITCLLYPPVDVDATSRILLVGFSDGVMRTLLLHPERLAETRASPLEVRVHSALTVHSEDSIHADVISLLSILKPHSKALVQISINETRTLLVTCGRDTTIFIYKLIHGTPFHLERLGFIETPNNVEYMTWKPQEEHVLLLCGQVGFIMEVVLPNIHLRDYKEITTFKLDFVSFKETLVKKHFMRNRPFPEEEDLASIDEEALKAREEMEDDEDEEDEWKGEIELIESESLLGTTITWAEYCDAGVWVVQRGTGALLLVQPGSNKIYKYAPFEAAWCDDITSLQFVCDGEYLVVGTNTGYIRVVRMPSEEEDSEEYHYIVWLTAQSKLLKKLKGRRLAKEEKQPTPRIDFSDRYYLAMHDYYTGHITSFEFSADGKYFYTCGADGNIFSYVINYDRSLIKHPVIPRAKSLTKIQKAKEHSTLEGEMMSHEELKQKEEYDKMMAIANAHKKRVRAQLAEITTEYNKIIKANKMLPVSQQIDMTLDPRPLVVQEEELDAAKALTRRKISHQLEASDRALDKMYSRNIIQCDVYPFTLRAIRDPAVMIRPLRQKNLSKAFWAQLEEVYEKMAEAALRGRRTESTVRKAGLRKTSWGPPRVASFLLGLPPRPPHPLKKALRNYHLRLDRHHRQMIEWQEHLSRKPDPNAMPPGAAEALTEAEASIGNKLLKTAPEYIAPPGHNTQLRVCMTRKEIYDNKREFNAKVLQLREHKVRLVKQMEMTGERLAEIRLEIPATMAKPPPPIPTIDEELEFPEKNLEVKPEPIQAAVMRSGKRSVVSERKKSGLYPQPRLRQPKVPPFRDLYETKPLTASWELLKARPDMESTEVEIEIRNRRIHRHLYEQDMLLADAQVSIQEFDAQLRKLQRERIRVQEKNQLLELHLYQLHREMNVLNRFESHEDRLAERVYAKLMQVRAVQELIADCEHRIEEHKETKESLALACENLQLQFKKMVVDDKFADFLRRIFKKKYRPVRDRDDDESSEEESSSSSSEEEDEGSLDSRDIGPIRLDPAICPEGCSEELYQKTYEMRNTRHRHEQDMIDQDRLIELLRKDIDAHNKVKRKLSAQLDTRKNDLREFMLEKQNCLNEVEQVVVLRYDQIRASALRGCCGPAGLGETVVFEESTLRRLRRRVLELHDEIRLQRERQKVNRTHLFRMNVDMRAMEATAEEIRAQMRDVLTKKLGKPRKVDKTLDDLLRQMARRHKFTSNLGSIPQILVQLRAWRDRHADLEKKYMKALHHHSDRLRLAAAIQADVLPQKPPKDPSKMPGDYPPEQYQRDVVRLKIVRAQQEQQIKSLREEIKDLRLKPLSKMPEPQVEPEEEEEEPIYLFMVPRVKKNLKHKYFPITPIASQTQVLDVTVMTLVNNCLDALRVSRELAKELLTDLTAQLQFVTAGTKTRYEVVDELVNLWLAKTGGDPSRYKKRTKAFDALAALADRLCRDQVEAMEGPTNTNQQVMGQLEAALRDVADTAESLQKRIGPAIAALFTSAHASEIETEETMTSLVHSLIDAEHPLTAEALQEIDEFNIIEDMRDCGVLAPQEDLQRIVSLAVECLRAQQLRESDTVSVQQEIQKDLQRARSATSSTGGRKQSIQSGVGPGEPADGADASTAEKGQNTDRQRE